MKAQIEGMYPGEPMVLDDQGRRVSLVLRLIPESPAEVAQLKKFCRWTEAFSFHIDEDFRENSAHVAPVFGERSFSIVPRPAYPEEVR